MNQIGYFLFSLDTELATGHFDKDVKRHRVFSQDGIRERERVEKVLRLCEKFDIHATWAVVGHLFFSGCEYCENCPLALWKGKYASYDEVYGTENPLWYGHDVIQTIQNCKVKQEIGFHGHSHMVFSEDKMKVDQAELEIAEWKRLATRYGIVGKSVVFPRDKIGHLTQLSAAGFENFREDIKLPLLIRNKYFGRYLKTIDHILGITTAPSYPVRCDIEEGMVRFTTSQELFAFNRSVDRVLDKFGLPLLRIHRTLRGVRQAAKKGEVFHVWAHPWEFETDGDIIKLEAIFSEVSRAREQGLMQSLTLDNMAKLLRSVKQEGIDD